VSIPGNEYIDSGLSEAEFVCCGEFSMMCYKNASSYGHSIDKIHRRCCEDGWEKFKDGD